MTTHTETFERNILIDQHWESYNSFYDVNWAEQITAIGKGTKVEEPIFNLYVNWKSSINAQAFPWLLVGMLGNLQLGHLSSIEPIPAPFLPILENHILARIRLNYKEQKELSKIMGETSEMIDVALNQAKQEVIASNVHGPDKFWELFIRPECKEFALAVWGSQRECFGSLFHTYEDFIRDLIAIAKGNPNYQARGFIDLKNDFIHYFGLGVCDYCLTDESIDIARKVRNRLAHNGGKISDELRTLDHGIIVKDDLFQIMPPDNRKLFDLLKVRALKLTEVAAALPGMQFSHAVA